MTKPALGGLLVSLLVSTATFGDVASLQDIGAAGVVFSDGTNIRYCASGVSNCSSASVLASAGGWGVPRLSPDGTKLAYGDVNSADVADFNRATGLSNITSLESGEGTNGAYSLAWSSDSQTIYTYEPEGVNGTRQHVIETYSRSGGARTGTLSVPAGSGSTIYRLILGDTHPDTGRLVAIAGTSTGASIRATSTMKRGPRRWLLTAQSTSSMSRTRSSRRALVSLSARARPITLVSKSEAIMASGHRRVISSSRPVPLWVREKHWTPAWGLCTYIGRQRRRFTG